MSECTTKQNVKRIENSFFGCHDTIRYGFRSVSHELRDAHPIEFSVQNSENTLIKSRLATIENIFGPAYATDFAMDLKALSSGNRCNRLSHDILLGNDLKIDFADVFRCSSVERRLHNLEEQ